VRDFLGNCYDGRVDFGGYCFRPLIFPAQLAMQDRGDPKRSRLFPPSILDEKSNELQHTIGGLAVIQNVVVQIKPFQKIRKYRWLKK